MPKARFTLRPEDAGFVARAPIVHSFSARLDAPGDTVFDALVADPQTWTWWPGLRNARYTSAEPHGVGSQRVAETGGTRYEETILVWERPSRWAWRVDACSVPLAHALVETWEVEAHARSSTARWTFAIDPRLGFRAAGPVAPLLMRRIFAKAMRNLELQLHAVTTPEAT